MTEKWTVDKMIKYLAAHGIKDGDTYTLGGFGGGDVDGLEFIDGSWYTYFSQRGEKTNYKKWDDEHSAVCYVKERAEKLAKVYGMWRDLSS